MLTLGSDRGELSVGSMGFAATFDRACALPILVLAALRRLWSPVGSDRIWDWLSAAVLVAAAVLVLLTFADYGVTWDEDVHNWYGVFALDYYLSLFTDQRALH